LDIVFSYSPTWLLLIIALAALISYWFYKGDRAFGEQSIWIPRILAIFRFISLSFIAFFLLEPLIRTETQDIQKPIIAIALDNSESVVNGADSVYYKTTFIEEIKSLTNALRESYDVELLAFDEKVKKGIDLDYKGKTTDLSNLLNELETRYYNRNLGAVIVASDGNYNKGLNPSYAPISLNAPFHTIVLGDTGHVNDLAIDEIIHNKISFLGDDFPLEINLIAEGLSNENYSLEVFNKGISVFKKSGEIDSENWYKGIVTSLPANNTGIQKYTVVVKSNSNEALKRNNKGVFYINILDERLKIAIISSAPHPDVAVWKNALRQNKNYEVEVIDIDQFDKNVNDYSLFILYQVPTSKKDNILINSIIDAKIPYLIQIGLNTDLTSLGEAIKNNYAIIGDANTEENISIKINDSFSLFSIDQKIISNQTTFPPLRAPLIELKSKELYQELMTKQLGSLDTGLPIWVLSESSDHKSGVIIGEGIWRWSMNSYSQYSSHDQFYEFLQQTSKYLVRKERNKRFDISINKEYFEGTRIKMNARLLNPSMEFATGGDISFSLINENGEQFEYAFSESSNKYALDLGALQAGEYNYTSKAKLSNESFTLEGKFTVKKMMLEQKDSHANASLLFQWSNKTGGKLFYPNQLDQLKSEINKSNLPSVSYNTESFSDMIRLSFLFFIIQFRYL
jgi:hypothetical protein